MDNNRSDEARNLERIAHALGLRVADFFDNNISPVRRSQVKAPNDMLDLLLAFAEVTDPDKRKACIEAVKGLSRK